MKSVYIGQTDLPPAVNCSPIEGIPTDVVDDAIPTFCSDGTQDPSLENIPTNPIASWTEENSVDQKVGWGNHRQCDPVTKGYIINPPGEGNSDFIYRYNRAIRGCEEAVQQVFKEKIIVLDDEGAGHVVPLMPVPAERAIAMLIQENVRKDTSGVVGRVKLPMMAVSEVGINPAPNRFTYSEARDYLRRYRPDNKPGFTIDDGKARGTVFGVSRGAPIDINYKLTVWTSFREDMAQILEQIILKFQPFVYLQVNGVYWEVVLKLDSIGNSVNTQPGLDLRIFKYEFNMTAETYIPQPIYRTESVQKVTVDVHNSTDPSKVFETLARIEEMVSGLDTDGRGP